MAGFFSQTLANLYAALVAKFPVQSADIAAGAVTQRILGAVFSGSTASRTEVLLQQISITTTGGDILVIATVVFTNASLTPGYLKVGRDGLTTTLLAAASELGVNAYDSVAGIYLFTAVPAGAHTIQCNYYADAGTLGASVGYPVVVELKK